MMNRNVVCYIVFFAFETVFLSYMAYLYYHYPVDIEPSSRVKYSTLLPASMERNCNYSRCSPAWLFTFLLIIVPVRPQGIKARQLIRNTWYKGFKDSEDCMLRFAVGSRGLGPNKTVEIAKENTTHGDIIYLDVVERVDALTNKTLAMMRWAHLHVNFSYLMKSDDDTYVFVKNMISELRKRPTDTKLYYGIILIHNQPIRGNYKWKDSEWDLSSEYLPFALGGGYILSHDLVKFISELSPQLKWHVNEDTTIGAWVSAFNHERRSDNMFCQASKFSKNQPNCNKTILALLFFGFSQDELRQQFYHIYEQVNSTKPIQIIKEKTAPQKKDTAVVAKKKTQEKEKSTVAVSTNSTGKPVTHSEPTNLKVTKSANVSTLSDSSKSTNSSVTEMTKTMSNSTSIT